MTRTLIIVTVALASLGLGYFIGTVKSSVDEKFKTIDNIMSTLDTLQELTVTRNSKREGIEDSFPGFVKATKLPDSLVISVDNIITDDFNADGKDDFASLVTNQKNGFRGVMIIHNEVKPKYFVIGVGQAINGITNLNRIEIFKKFPKIQDVKPDVVDVVTGEIIEDNTKILKVTGAAIYTRFDESVGGEVLFWTGKKYDWFHMD